ncbi:MAG: PTS sugar transporter subunit IIA [Verrucomicrobia bacterium]|nr:PTS sugar transporter subunit IIA [Verrucomicrobiota bacterium]
MKLTQLLSHRHIVPDLRATDRWQAMDELLDHLEMVGDLTAALREEVSQSLQLRENMVSTGVGGGVAIPHAFSDHTDEVIAVFGRSREGIDFDSLDHGIVHFVILFISPRKSYQKHLHALAAIARMFTRAETCAKMLSAADAEDIFALFWQKTVTP